MLAHEGLRARHLATKGEPAIRRFEFVEGKSSKFWEIALEGESFTVRFGRIGTTGQSQVKAFSTAEKARAEHDKLVREKVGKGYQEIGAVSAMAPERGSDAKATAAGAPMEGSGSPVAESTAASSVTQVARAAPASPDLAVAQASQGSPGGRPPGRVSPAPSTRIISSAIPRPSTPARRNTAKRGCLPHSTHSSPAWERS